MGHTDDVLMDAVPLQRSICSMINNNRMNSLLSFHRKKEVLNDEKNYRYSKWNMFL